MGFGQQELGRLGTFDSLYVSPHWDDVSLACAARLLRDRARRVKVLVVTVFGHGPEGDPEATYLSLGLPVARERSPRYSSFAALAEGREPADEECLRQAVAALVAVAHSTQAREVFIPLALGGHIDHRLSHEAAGAAFHGDEGRNVFFYEERPEVFLRGAVRLRLGRLGVRLPPAAAEAAEGAAVPSYFFKFGAAPAFRGDVTGRLGKLSTVPVALRQWQAARTWRPLKALGPRLQPVVYPTERALLESVKAFLPLPPELEREAEAYAERLGAGPHAERYWLLLPSPVGEGFESLGG